MEIYVYISSLLFQCRIGGGLVPKIISLECLKCSQNSVRINNTEIQLEQSDIDEIIDRLRLIYNNQESNFVKNYLEEENSSKERLETNPFEKGIFPIEDTQTFKNIELLNLPVEKSAKTLEDFPYSKEIGNKIDAFMKEVSKLSLSYFEEFRLHDMYESFMLMEMHDAVRKAMKEKLDKTVLTKLLRTWKR